MGVSIKHYCKQNGIFKILPMAIRIEDSFLKTNNRNLEKNSLKLNKILTFCVQVALFIMDETS